MFAYFTAAVKGDAASAITAAEYRNVRVLGIVLDGIDRTDTILRLCSTLAVMQDWYAEDYTSNAPYPAGALLYFTRNRDEVAA